MTVDLSNPFIQARWFYKGRTSPVGLIVLHDMEAPETDKTAENVARNFSTTDRKASAHDCIDNNSIVHCVKYEDTAWAAPGANSNGIHLEHAGYAAQRREDWLDGYSLAELKLSAQLTAALCGKFNIPEEFVDVAGLKAGRRGITTHNCVSLAFKKSTHTDPGPGFPMDLYVEMVRGESGPDLPPLLPTQTGARVQANAPMVGIITSPHWRGYLEVGADGGVFQFEAPFFGSAGGIKLNAPVVAGASTPSGEGYWLVAADGGVFPYGDAKFYGSTGNVTLNKPIVGIAVSDTGQGYGLVASDGGVFAFGDFEFFGSAEFKG